MIVTYPIPLWEEWVIVSSCSEKLLLLRVSVWEPLSITSGVFSHKITVMRVLQKHLNNWRCCFMVQWRTSLDLWTGVGVITLRRSASTHRRRSWSVTRERAPGHSPAERRTAVRSDSGFPAQRGFCQANQHPAANLWSVPALIMASVFRPLSLRGLPSRLKRSVHAVLSLYNTWAIQCAIRPLACVKMRQYNRISQCDQPDRISSFALTLYSPCHDEYALGFSTDRCYFFKK